MTDLEALDLLRADPTSTALFTDFDGTLSPIVEDPAAARPLPGATEAMARLAGRYRRMAVLSGRPLSFLAPLLPAAVDVAALYGLERRVAGETSEDPEVEQWREVVARATTSAEEHFGTVPGVTVEPKGVSLTVHFRNAPGSAGEIRAWAEEAGARSGLSARPAKASVELHPPVQVDKGVVLEEWAGDAAIVAFFGDDAGDLAAFDGLDRLRRRGRTTLAVAVASGEAPAELLRRAELTLDGPEAVADLFQRLAAAH